MLHKSLRWPLAAVLIAVFACPAMAESVSISWDPVTLKADGSPCIDLAGYYLYYGTASGTYTLMLDAGNTISATVDGLTDCTTSYFAVTAYDTSGNESDYSNEGSGWPRPVVATSSPSAAEQGRVLVVDIGGSNFMPGATVRFVGAGISVSSATVNSCTQITANVGASDSATVGLSNVEVTNPDQVSGTGLNLFTVQAAEPPAIAATDPADSVIEVSTDVRPSVTFSEAMLASSVNVATVLLVDSAGAAAAQTADSPGLSPNGLTATITPAAALAAGKTYRIQVLGGSAGVMDLASHPMTSTYTQGAGFATAEDTTPPAIAEVLAGSVGSSTATITWTTDVPADSQVFYRMSGQIGYQKTDIDPTLPTAHAVDLTGLDPASSYQYHARSADAVGNPSISSPDQSFETSSSTYTFLRFETEEGSLTTPVEAASGVGTFDSGSITTPAGTPAGSTDSPSGAAGYGVYIPSADTWYLWIRLFGQDSLSSSWFESMDGATRQPIFVSRYGAWTWVAGRSYALSQGLHDLELGGYDAQAMADRVLLTNERSFVPTEQPVDDQVVPAPPFPFTAAAGGVRVTLSWGNPPDTDFQKSVIRYRTDGKYPVSPADGFGVTTRPAASGSADGFIHTGLVAGTTYSYSAFAVDVSGNVSGAAHAQATPVRRQMNPRPGSAIEVEVVPDP